MRRLSYLLAFGPLLLSCKDPTQVKLNLTTDGDLGCPSPDPLAAGKLRLVSVGIVGAAELNQGEQQVFNAETTTCDSAGTVGSLVLVPAEGREGDLIEVMVVAAVEGASGAGTLKDCDIARMNEDAPQLASCIVARRRIGFIKSRPLYLPIELDSDCLGKLCDENSTCYQGSCVDSAATCDERGNCELPAEAGGGGSGAGPSNGGGGNGGTTNGGNGGTTNGGNGGTTNGGSGGTTNGGSGGANVGAGGDGGNGGTTNGGNGGTTSGGGGTNPSGGGGISPGVCPGPTPIINCAADCPGYCAMTGCVANCVAANQCICEQGIAID